MKNENNENLIYETAKFGRQTHKISELLLLGHINKQYPTDLSLTRASYETWTKIMYQNENHMYLFNNQTKRDNQTKVKIWDPQALKTCPRGHPRE